MNRRSHKHDIFLRTISHVVTEFVSRHKCLITERTSACLIVARKTSIQSYLQCMNSSRLYYKLEKGQTYYIFRVLSNRMRARSSVVIRIQRHVSISFYSSEPVNIDILEDNQNIMRRTDSCSSDGITRPLISSVVGLSDLMSYTSHCCGYMQFSCRSVQTQTYSLLAVGLGYNFCEADDLIERIIV